MQIHAATGNSIISNQRRGYQFDTVNAPPDAHGASNVVGDFESRKLRAHKVPVHVEDQVTTLGDKGADGCTRIRHDGKIGSDCTIGRVQC